MPSNDTQNIYSSEYGGEGAPIPATKIGYDNTTSGLTADDVQGAIDEVVSDINTVAGDVETLETALNDTYVLVNSDVNIEVTADGVKSYSDLMDDLNTAFLAYLAAMEDDELLFLTRAQVQNVATLAPLGKVSGYNNTDVSVSPSFTRVELDSTNLLVTSFRFGGTKSFLICGITAVPAVTIADKKSDVPTEGLKIVVSAHLYKQV